MSTVQQKTATIPIVDMTDDLLGAIAKPREEVAAEFLPAEEEHSPERS